MLLMCSITFAQIKEVKKDTTEKKIVIPKPDIVEEKKDTTLYKKIEKFSNKSKFTKLLHKAIFEPSENKSSNPIRRPKVKQYKK